MTIKHLIQGFLILGILLIALLLPAYAIADQQAANSEHIANLIKTLESKRQEHHIPGMAIAVVKDDQIIISQGFGVMDLEQQIPVTSETLFAIGSASKSFTATMAAMLVDQGKIHWDDEVTKYLPDYQFTVDGKSLPITLRDALSHRTGYTRNDLLWANGQASRDLILETATKALPWDDFRASFHYNNVMYLAAGEVIAKLAGSSWDDYLKQAIFAPLGMHNSTSIHQSAVASEAISLGYQWNDETESHDLMPRRNLNNVAPAGGIYSNVTDMAQWVRMLLKQGQKDGKPLVSPEQLHATWEPAISISDQMNYGMGWFLRTWQNQRVVEHGGNIDGYGAQVALLPESKLGFVLLTNVTATPLQQESVNLVWEHLAADESLASEEGDIKPGTDYQEFVGEYHANFASFKDSMFTFLINENGRPAVDVPGQTVYELKDPDAEGKWYFAMTDSISVSFDRSDNGSVTAMRLHQNRLDFELPKKGVKILPEVDPVELQPYLGQYQSKTFNGTIHAIMQNHRLTLDVPGKMAFELHLPDAQGFRQFRIKDDMSAKFETNDEGEIVELVLYRDQSKVVDTAPRKAAEDREPLPDVKALMKLMNTQKQLKALRKKSGFQLSGTVEMVHAGLTGKVTTAFEAKHNFKQHMDFGTFGEIDVAVNEQGGATKGINPYTEFKGKYLKQVRMEHPSMALDLLNQADSMQVLGIRELHDRKAYVLKVKIADMPSRTYFIDTLSGDVLRLKTKLMNPVTGSIPVTIDYSDYRTKHGLRMPMTVNIKNPMMGLATIRYEEFKTKQQFKPGYFVINP